MAKRKNTPKVTAPVDEPSKLFTNLLKTTRQYILGRNYTPVAFDEMMQRLSLPEQHQDVFEAILKTLIKEGAVTLKKNLYHPFEVVESVVSGVISMHPRGFGFVRLDVPTAEGDVFIPKHLTMNAVDGDQVEVIVNTSSPSEKGPEGKVVAILSRSRTHVAGIITKASSFGEILAYVPILGTAQTIIVQPTDLIKLKEGDRVVMKVVEWGTKDSDTVCSVSHYLGHISDPACDIPAAIEEYELRDEFSSKVIEEAESFGSRVSPKDFEGRQDLRELECFTIDPTTAKDFDDALTLSRTKKQGYHLIVHIADVSHYVKEGSAIDKEASKRCNSTYFPGTCLPMLPRALSENLCSLKANVNRLAVSISMHFDATGELLSHEIFRSVIKSAKRFTYNEAKEVLDGKRKSKHLPTLNLMVELCGLLKVKRFERGSLEFSLPDLVIKVDSDGVPTGTEYVTYDITHQMVEEFMLKANETVAHHLHKQGKHLAYRVHDEPSEENMKDFAILASAFGFNLPEIPTPKDLQKLFDEAVETPYSQYLAVSYIRRMRQALYSAENIGHYGLGLTHYCHFTSPIRRYVDLIVHRSIFGEALELKKLDLIAQESSEQERISAKAENHVTLLKKLRLLDNIHQETPGKQYDAVITRVKNFGFSFEILDFLLEGFLHVSELDDDYFIFDEKGMRLYGRHTSKTYCSGERITVMLKSVNFIQLESRWNLVGERGTFRSKAKEKEKRWDKKKRAERREAKRERKKKHFEEKIEDKKEAVEAPSIAAKSTHKPKKKRVKEKEVVVVAEAATPKVSKAAPKATPKGAASKAPKAVPTESKVAKNVKKPATPIATSKKQTKKAPEVVVEPKVEPKAVKPSAKKEASIKKEAPKKIKKAEPKPVDKTSSKSKAVKATPAAKVTEIKPKKAPPKPAKKPTKKKEPST